MHHACYFAPLSPTRNYPTAPFDVQIGGRTFDLPLAPAAAAYIAKEVTDPRNEYFRSRVFKHPRSIAALRRTPHRLYFEATRPASFAEIVVTERIGRGGRTAQVLFISTELCAALLVNAWDRYPDLAQAAPSDLRRYTEYFAESKGFEVMRIWYWFSASEMDGLSLDNSGIPLLDYSQNAPAVLAEVGG